LFDQGRPDGLRSLNGFEQSQRIVWVPRPQAVRATDLSEAPGRKGAVAVSRLGLLLLDDSTGALVAERPGAQLPLTAYQTGNLFLWQGKLFLSLYQEPPAVMPPATLAWWSSGQTRLAFYPIPSQIREASRQIYAMRPPAQDSSTVVFDWKHPGDKGWVLDRTEFVLDSGLEEPATGLLVADQKPLTADLLALKAKLAERLGSGVVSKTAVGTGPLLLFTDAGWVAVGLPGEARVRLYRLPDLGVAGHYVGALSLAKGFIFTWETTLRGYVGAAGLVHVPFGVLAP